MKTQGHSPWVRGVGDHGRGGWLGAGRGSTRLGESRNWRGGREETCEAVEEVGGAAGDFVFAEAEVAGAEGVGRVVDGGCRRDGCWIGWGSCG